MVRNYGCPLDMNDSLTYVTSVAALRMMTGIVNNGLSQKEVFQLNLNSLGHGFVLHLFFHQGKMSLRSLTFTLNGEKIHLLRQH